MILPGICACGQNIPLIVTESAKTCSFDCTRCGLSRTLTVEIKEDGTFMAKSWEAVCSCGRLVDLVPSEESFRMDCPCGIHRTLTRTKG